MEIEKKIMSKIDKYSEAGNRLLKNNEFDKAVEKYNEALNLIPEPKRNWEASQWLYASIGDAYFSKSDFNNALLNFMEAYNIDEGHLNPFILLRIGQCYYHLNNEKNAVEYLLRAYMLDGRKIFKGEEKYFKFLSSKVKL